MLPRRPLRGFVFFFVLAATALAPAAWAQTSVTVWVKPPEDWSWKKLPHRTVEGKVLGSNCSSLLLATAHTLLLLSPWRAWSYLPPKGMRLLYLGPSEAMDGLCVPVTYLPGKNRGYDGQFTEVRFVSAVPEGSKKPAAIFAPARQTKKKASKPPPKKRPEKATAEGDVQNVTCDGWQLFLLLDISGYTLKLHAADYRKVAFYLPGAKSAEVYEPCRRLKGHTAKIEYEVVKGKSYGGEILSVAVE